MLPAILSISGRREASLSNRRCLAGNVGPSGSLRLHAGEGTSDPSAAYAQPHGVIVVDLLQIYPDLSMWRIDQRQMLIANVPRCAIELVSEDPESSQTFCHCRLETMRTLARLRVFVVQMLSVSLDLLDDPRGPLVNAGFERGDARMYAPRSHDTRFAICSGLFTCCVDGSNHSAWIDCAVEERASVLIAQLSSDPSNSTIFRYQGLTEAKGRQMTCG
nr:hypothetical protein CFP56_24406 [Quercus suber]